MSSQHTHLEYSFVLQSSHLGDKSRKATNPFSGTPVEFPADDELTTDELAAIEEALESAGFDDPGQDGYVLSGEHGDYVRFGFPDLGEEPTVVSVEAELVVRNLTDSVLRLVFQVVRAGNLVLMSPVGNIVRTVGPPLTPLIRERWPDVKQLRSADELRGWFEIELTPRKVSVPL